MLFPFGGLTRGDRAFLQSIYISAPPYQSTVDLSSLTDEKIQGYAIVLKIIAGKRSFTLCLKCLVEERYSQLFMQPKQA